MKFIIFVKLLFVSAFVQATLPKDDSKVEFTKIIQAFAKKAVEVDESETTATWISQLNHITTFSKHSESFQNLLKTSSSDPINRLDVERILNLSKEIESDSLNRFLDPSWENFKSPRTLGAFKEAILRLLDVIEFTRKEIKSVETRIARTINSKCVENPWLTNAKVTKWEQINNITHVGLKEIKRELHSKTHMDYVNSLHKSFDEDVEVATNMKAECIRLFEERAQIFKELRIKAHSEREENSLNNIEVLLGPVIKLFMRQNELLMSLNRVHLRIKNHQQYRLIWVEKLIG